MIADIDLESPEAEVPQATVYSADASSDVTLQEIHRYLVVNTIFLQTIVRDLEEIKEKLGA